MQLNQSNCTTNNLPRSALPNFNLLYQSTRTRAKPPKTPKIKIRSEPQQTRPQHHKSPRPRTAQIGQTRPQHHKTTTARTAHRNTTRPQHPAQPTRSLRDRSTPLQSRPIVAAPRSHTIVAPNHPIRRLQHRRSLLEVDRGRTPRSDPRSGRSQARSAHSNSSKGFRQLIEGGTSRSTAPQLCPEHNPHRRGKEGEIEEGRSKPPYAESPLISKNKGKQGEEKDSKTKSCLHREEISTRRKAAFTLSLLQRRNERKMIGKLL
ncbi:hypothetical protein ACOSP7_017765 [Xanthoceras sorbifolium]